MIILPSFLIKGPQLVSLIWCLLIFLKSKSYQLIYFGDFTVLLPEVFYLLEWLCVTVVTYLFVSFISCSLLLETGILSVSLTCLAPLCTGPSHMLFLLPLLLYKLVSCYLLTLYHSSDFHFLTDPGGRVPCPCCGQLCLRSQDTLNFSFASLLIVIWFMLMLFLSWFFFPL